MKRYVRYKTLWVALAMVILCGSWMACNDDLTDGLKKDYPESGYTQRDGHVLWIILNGASGTAVREANNDRKAENLSAMMSHASYTFAGLADTRSDTVVSNRVGWDNLFTGLLNRTSDTPDILSLLKKLDAGCRTEVWASTDDFYQEYALKADQSFQGTDAQITTQVADELSAGQDAPSLLVVEYNGVEQAGEQYGFVIPDSLDNGGQPTTEVISAVSTVDRYIGQIMSALENRPGYRDENWMVVITSPSGGVADNTGENVYEMKDRNAFVMIYNYKLGKELLLAPSSEGTTEYKYWTPIYGYKNATDYAKVIDPTLFDMVYDPGDGSMPYDTVSYTVQFMVYCPQGPGWNHSRPFVSKEVQSHTSQGQGWEVACDGWCVITRYGGQELWSQNSWSTLTDNKWHVLTAVFDFKHQKFIQYTDGRSDLYADAAYKDLTYNLSVGDKAPLTVGQKVFNASGGNEGTTNYITNVQFYDVALPVDFIEKNYNLTGLDELGESYPYWDHLIGYWPGDREEDYRSDVLPDYSQYGSVYGGVNAGRSDMKLSSAVLWTTGTVVDDNVKPPYTNSYYQTSINLVDIPYMTFQWLGFAVPEAWGWTGIARTLPYEDLITND
ncbi:MAG: alkaline phosphatase family protein [Paraprevotella sp.]|nr:alkaline phosphatase family protein [Paraprevotella sp.]